MGLNGERDISDRDVIKFAEPYRNAL